MVVILIVLAAGLLVVSFGVGVIKGKADLYKQLTEERKKQEQYEQGKA